jgi:ribosomal protein S12 methylthiotransferase accessory factor
MSTGKRATEVVVTLPGRRRVDAIVGGHLVRTDQSLEAGGDGTAPSPFDLFLASLGACAGVFVQSFCAARGLSTEGVHIRQTAAFDEHGTLTSVQIEIDLPEGFPDRYRDAVARAAEQCSVKRAIQARPSFNVRARHAPVAAMP